MASGSFGAVNCNDQVERWSFLFNILERFSVIKSDSKPPILVDDGALIKWRQLLFVMSVSTVFTFDSADSEGALA